MAGRGMLFDEGPTACPFVALETDRDRRSAEPDPRHRCYAEPTPAPRALAHQRQFCLAPDFGDCPIFRDWAIRAAARPVPLRPIPEPLTRRSDAPPDGADAATAEPHDEPDVPAFLAPPRPEPGARAQPEPGARTQPEPAAAAEGSPATPTAAEPAPIERVPSLPLDDGPARGEGEPPRAAEPPAAQLPAAQSPAADAHSPGAARPPRGEAAPPDEPSAEPPPRRRWDADWPPAASAAEPSPFLADRQSRAAADERPAEPVGASATGARGPRRVDYAQRREGGDGPAARPSTREEWAARRADLIPAWERQRYAAYPTLGTRMGIGDTGLLLSRLTRIFAIAALIALLAALLILAPDFLGGIAAPPSPSPSPSPTVSLAPTPSPTPAPTPEPTVLTHRVEPGETLFAIALEYGVTLEQILAANPSITDPNLIQAGQLIVIPPPDFVVPTQQPPASP